jgi:hypothetical protein
MNLSKELWDKKHIFVEIVKYAKEKLLEKIFGDFEKLPTKEKIEYLIKLNSPTKEAIIALLLTILRN